MKFRASADLSRFSCLLASSVVPRAQLPPIERELRCKNERDPDFIVEEDEEEEDDERVGGVDRIRGAAIRDEIAQMLQE